MAQKMTAREMEIRNLTLDEVTLDDRPYTVEECGCVIYHAFTTGHVCPCGCGDWLTGTHYSTWVDPENCDGSCE